MFVQTTSVWHLFSHYRKDGRWCSPAEGVHCGLHEDNTHLPLRGGGCPVVPLGNGAPCNCYCYLHSYLLVNFQYTWAEGIKVMGKNPALTLPPTWGANGVHTLPFIEVFNILKATRLYETTQKSESQKDPHGYHCFKRTGQIILLHIMSAGGWIAFLDQEAGRGKRCW